MVRLIEYPALKQALSVSGIKCSEVHSKSFYCTKLTDYSLKNKKLKDLLIQLVYKKPVLFVVFYAVGCFQPTVLEIKIICFSNSHIYPSRGGVYNPMRSRIRLRLFGINYSLRS